MTWSNFLNDDDLYRWMGCARSWIDWSLTLTPLNAIQLAQWFKGQSFTCDAEGPESESHVQDRGWTLLRSPMPGRDGRNISLSKISMKIPLTEPITTNVI